jgi:hypothetical protein
MSHQRAIALLFYISLSIISALVALPRSLSRFTIEPELLPSEIA